MIREDYKMFSDIDMKKWKKSFAFNNDNDTLLRLKYSHKWYFPAMLGMMLLLLFSFLLFIIGFFVLAKDNPTIHIVYSILIITFIFCWTSFYFLIQNRAISPYKRNSRGHIIFEEKIITIKHVENNTIEEYRYSDIRNFYFNKKTLGLAIVDNSNHIIFNEIMSADEIPEILNVLYEMTKLKPKIK